MAVELVIQHTDMYRVVYREAKDHPWLTHGKSFKDAFQAITGRKVVEYGDLFLFITFETEAEMLQFKLQWL